MADEEKRRKYPPCDLHELRICELEKKLIGIHLTMFGEDGRSGIQAESAFNHKALANLSKLMWTTLPVIFTGILIMVIKELFFK